MKTNRKLLFSNVLIVIIIASFFAGRYMTKKENSDKRIERCCTLIGFAIDKAENGDLTDQVVMRTLISNVYAAYQFCDDSKSAKQLHDLWNYLIFESDGNVDAVKDIALQELNAVLHFVKTTN